MLEWSNPPLFRLFDTWKYFPDEVENFSFNSILFASVVASLGSACTSDAQCIGPNTRCHNHACACQSDYIQSNDKSRCKRDTTWFVSFPLLHEKCKGFFADCYNGVEQVCSAGRCKCRNEQREAALNDIYIKHKSFTQCRNSSTSSGKLFKIVLSFVLKWCKITIMLQWT